jgi:hypothetical protein
MAVIMYYIILQPHPTCTIFFWGGGAGVEPSPLVLRPLIGLLYQTWIIDDDCEAFGGMTDYIHT